MVYVGWQWRNKYIPCSSSRCCDLTNSLLFKAVAKKSLAPTLAPIPHHNCAHKRSGSNSPERPGAFLHKPVTVLRLHQGLFRITKLPQAENCSVSDQKYLDQSHILGIYNLESISSTNIARKERGLMSSFDEGVV